MFDPFTAWSRLATVAFGNAETGLRASETATASRDVVRRRSAMIDSAMRNPLTGDYAELSRMVPEKVAAFSSAGSAFASHWWAMQSDLLGELQHVGTLMARGRPLGVAEVGALWSRQATHTLHMAEATAAMGAAALAPVHAAATSNATRLGKAKRRR